MNNQEEDNLKGQNKETEANHTSAAQSPSADQADHNTADEHMEIDEEGNEVKQDDQA